MTDSRLLENVLDEPWGPLTYRCGPLFEAFEMSMLIGSHLDCFHRIRVGVALRGSGVGSLFG